MSSATHSGVVYGYAIPETYPSITYIDPKNPPGHRVLLLRGLLETAWSFLFAPLVITALCIFNAVQEFAERPHVPVIGAVFLGALFTYLFFFPIFLLIAKETKKQFVEFGGDTTGINLLMFCGMMPIGWHRKNYEFLPPDKRNQLIAMTVAKPVTDPFF